MLRSLRHLAFSSPLLLAACDAPSPTPADAAAPVDVLAADAYAADLPLADLALIDRASTTEVDAAPPAFSSDAAVDVPWASDASADDCVRLGGASCFLPPPGAVRTNRGLLTFACTETPPAVTAAPSRVNVAVVDFATGEPVPSASVDLAPNDGFATVTHAMTAPEGIVQMTAPAGTPSRAFWRVTADGYLPSYSMSARFDVRLAENAQRLNAITPAMATFVRSLVGLAPAAAPTGIIATELDDCDGHAMENVVVTLSSTSSTIDQQGTHFRAPMFVPDARVFYFQGDATPLPVRRNQRIATSSNGVVVVFDVPETVGTARWYLQAWGYRADGALRLMGETPVRSIPGAVVLPEMQAFR